jgi:DNA-binding NarL/FixJ family response regulator
MNTPIRVVLADDEKLIRAGLKIMLETYDDIRIVGEAVDGKEALELCAEGVDVVLMDIRMPGVDGIEGTRMIKEAFPHVSVLMLTTFEDAAYIGRAMEYGASGYLLKDNSCEEIVDGIRVVALSGKVVLDRTVSQTLAAGLRESQKKTFDEKELQERYRLTERELALIRGVAEGRNNREIAAELFLSEGTVKNNLSVILSKLNLRDRTQLAIFAYEKGIV